MRRLSRTLLLSGLIGLAACATTPDDTAGIPEIPADARQVTRIEANGDEITEFRVGGQLHMVRVVPARGPTYYLFARDGRVGSNRENPPQTYFKLFGW